MTRIGICSFLSLLLSIFHIGVSYSQCTLNFPATITVCPNQNTLITPTLNTGFNFFSWTGLSGITNPNQSNPTINTAVGGTLTLTASGTSCPSQNISITVNLINSVAPIVNVATPQPFCSGSNISANVTNPQANTTYSWTFPGGAQATGLSVTGLASVSPGNNTITGNLIVSAFNTATGCTTSTSQSLSIRQAPDAGLSDFISTNPFNSCDGSSFNLAATNTSSTSATNTGYTINWGDGTPLLNLTPAQFPLFTDQTHVYTTFGFFNLVFTVNGSNGCNTTRTYQVFSGTNPGVGSSLPPGTVGACAPATFSFPINFAPTNTVGTTYTVTFNDNSAPINFTHPPPNSVSHTFDTSSCGAVSFSNGGSNSFEVKIVATNPCFISTAIISPITVNQKPTSNFNAPQQACAGQNVNFSNTTISGTTINSQFQCNSVSWIAWQITPAVGWNVVAGAVGTPPPSASPLTQGSQNLGVNFNTPGVYQVKLYARSPCGTDSIVRSICIQNVAQSIVSAIPLSGCSPLAVTTTNNSTGNSVCGTLSHNWTVSPFFGWSFTNGSNAQSVQPSFSFNSPGTFTITHTVTNGCGPSSSTLSVTVVSPPTAVINPINASCAPSSINPTAIVNNGGGNNLIYAWQFPGGSPATSNQLIPGIVLYANSGNSTINFTITNECGTQTASLPLLIPAPPLPPQLSSNSPVCLGQTGTLQVVNPQPGIIYQWTGPLGYSSTGSAIQLSNVQVSQSGNYSVVATAGACSSIPATINFQVTVAPVITITPTSPTICPGDSVNLIASGADSYQWSPNNGINNPTLADVMVTLAFTSVYTVTGTQIGNNCAGTTNITVNVLNPPTITANNVSICNQPTATQLTGFLPSGGVFSTVAAITLSPTGSVSPISTGTFVATYSFTAANGCSASANFNIVVVAPPAQPQLSSNSPVCLGETANLEVVNPQPGITYQWTGPLGYSSTGSAIQLTNTLVSQSGNYSVIATAGDCSSIPASVSFQVAIAPVITITPTSPSVCPGDSVNLIASGADLYQWTPIIGINNPTLANVLVSPSVASVYTVTGTQNGFNCPSTASVTVNILNIPQLFVFDQSVCNQLIPTPITGFLPSGGAFSSFENINITSSGIVTPLATGVFLATYAITDANGCIATADFNIVVQDPSNLNVGADVSVCQNSTAIQLSPTLGVWSGSTQVNNSGLFETNLPGVFNLVYTEGQGSCQISVNKIITVNSLPDILVNAPHWNLRWPSWRNLNKQFGLGRSVCVVRNWKCYTYWKFKSNFCYAFTYY